MDPFGATVTVCSEFVEPPVLGLCWCGHVLAKNNNTRQQEDSEKRSKGTDKRLVAHRARFDGSLAGGAVVLPMLSPCVE